jgi:hypothetical protein
MADTQRTKSAILSLFADNVTGQVSAQDLRDFVVTVMESEFVNAGDFWANPQAKYTTTDKTARGAKEYSQYMGSDCSWMNIMYQEASTGYWMRANVSDSTQTGRLGVAMDSYTSDFSTAIIMTGRGMIYDSSFSTIFSELLGRPVYLDSGVPGSISIGATGNSELIVGYITNSDDAGGSAIGKWLFLGEACWAVRGQ